MSDEPFDPRNIRPRVKQEDKPDLDPLKKRAAQPDSRMPFLTSIKEARKNTERGKTKAAKATTKRLRAEADRELAEKQVSIDKKTAEAKLKAAELELDNQDIQATALSEDKEAEIKFLKDKRALERKAEMARIKNQQRVDTFNTEQTINPQNPPKTPRERTKQEMMDDWYEKGKIIGLRVFGKETEKIADRIIQEFEDHGVKSLEALGEIDQNLEHMLRREFIAAEALDRTPK